jgi:hypothetical protein
VEPEDLWTDILEAATAGALCADADCRIEYLIHTGAGYTDIFHLDAGRHDCPFCGTLTFPRRVISSATVQRTRRSDLVRALASWLSHVHAQQTAAPRVATDPAPAGASAPLG